MYPVARLHGSSKSDDGPRARNTTMARRRIVVCQFAECEHLCSEQADMQADIPWIRHGVVHGQPGCVRRAGTSVELIEGNMRRRRGIGVNGRYTLSEERQGILDRVAGFERRKGAWQVPPVCLHAGEGGFRQVMEPIFVSKYYVSIWHDAL